MSDMSMLAPDCVDLTSGDQCKVMCAAGYTGSASTSICTLVVVNGSVSLIGILPNCPVASGAVDDIPSGTSNCCEGIICLESCHGNRSNGYGPVDVTAAALSCLSSALLDDDNEEGLDRSSL